jgi:maltooligosyltrehalose trehalohydrolase
MIEYRFGPRIEGSQTRFRLWAPSAALVEVEVADEGRFPTVRLDDGWVEGTAPCGAGARYRFVADGKPVPDPASREQDGGVHGWSVVRDEQRNKSEWHGRPWRESVLYELHPGIFGGFRGIAQRLEELASIGITAVELMPIGDFPGKRNWGYDGVLPFAPSPGYGTPDELRALIDRAHELNLMVFLDVVYNHFGPDGNYIAVYAKEFFRHDVRTPWGDAIDFRKTPVQQFFCENAHYLLGEFGFDGLRFDAVHAIADETGWLDNLAQDLRESFPDRQIHLVVENEDNDATHLRLGFDAQWNDDIHHVLHVMLTRENAGYYRDFETQPAVRLARALREGFIYQGEASAAHEGKPRGTRSHDLPPTSFVSFLQNHDQTGNRAFGDRLTVLTQPKALEAAVALLLLAPQIPLIFMGEEFGSKAPFLYFTDHGPELADAVRRGRKQEFAAFADSSGRELPDPNSPETFHASEPWQNAPEKEHWIGLYKNLLSIRRTEIVPHLDGATALDASAIAEKAVLARWRLGDAGVLTIACNLDRLSVDAELPAVRPIWGNAERDVVPGETTLAWIER